jgi:hypothetical protein
LLLFFWKKEKKLKKKGIKNVDKFLKILYKRKDFN